METAALTWCGGGGIDIGLKRPVKSITPNNRTIFEKNYNGNNIKKIKLNEKSIVISRAMKNYLFSVLL